MSHYAEFEFVRPAGTATRDDATVVKEGGSLWLSPEGGLHWLHPTTIRSTPGMADKMRAALDRHALQNEGDRTAPWAPHPLETGDVVADESEPPAQQRKVQIVEGQTDDWRWFRVESGEDQIVVIDNKPRVERCHSEAYDEGGRSRPGMTLPPYLESVRIPVAHFEVIARSVIGPS